MKTIETITAILTASREEYRTIANAARQAVADLEAVYRDTIEKTPAETVAAYVERVGYDVAVSTIATLVNRSASDGRISRRCAEWAATREGAFDAEAAERLWIYSDRIHKAHLDQLATAMIEYSPAQPEEAETETPAILPHNVFDRIAKALQARKDRSAWNKGVNLYALELVEELQYHYDYETREPYNLRELESWLLNGAADWKEYSWGGCSLIYNKDIAARLCTASELKKTDNGRKDPNPREQWLDTQARALYQASRRVVEEYNRINSEEIPLF